MAKNLILPVIRWQKKHGAILDLLDALNSGHQQKEIADRFGISRSQLCKFVEQTFTKHYILREEIREVLDEMEVHRTKRIIEARKEQARILQLVSRDTPAKEKTG